MNENPTVENSAVWRDLDARAGDATRFLDLITRITANNKRRSMDRLALRPGMTVLEVGCGTGRDAEALAALVGPVGRVVGIDASKGLIEQAVERLAPSHLPITLQVGDAQFLDFPDDSFDAARTDRVLQHLSDPGAAIREMARVVRPGGRIVALEPDWEMTAVSGDDLAVTRALIRHKVEAVVAQPLIARELRRLFLIAACGDVIIEPIGLCFADLPTADTVLSLRSSLNDAVSAGQIAEHEAHTWWRALEAHDQGGTFFAAIWSAPLWVDRFGEMN